MLRPIDCIRLTLFLFLLCSQLSTPASGQQWLTEPSYSGQAIDIPHVPSLPAEGLQEPPPPLPPAETVIDQPSVFDQPMEPEPQVVWYYPWTWIPLDGWKNSAELGLNSSSGNTESMSFQAGARFKRETDFNIFDLRITHNRTDANGIETQNNALMYADFERFLGDSPWTFFVKNGLEYDEFRAFDLRYNINSGFGYSFFRTDDLTLTGRFGAGASREFGGPDNAWAPEALFGGDYEHQVTKRNKLIARIDYFPEWGNFSNYRLVADVAWEYLLDEEGNLSLKMGANDRYDSTPNGRQANDINYSALLLYKF